MWWIVFAVVFLIMVVLPRLQQSSLSADELRALLDGGAVLLDVRSPGEFAGGSVPEARNLPVERVGQDIAQVVPDQSTAVILYCASGMRSGMAAKRLRGLGYTTVINLGSLGRARQLVAQAQQR